MLAEHAHQPLATAELLLQDREDLARAERRVTPGSLPRLLGEAQSDPLGGGVAVLRELRVPDFVRVFHPGPQPRIEPVPDQPGEAADEVVVPLARLGRQTRA